MTEPEGPGRVATGRTPGSTGRAGGRAGRRPCLGRRGRATWRTEAPLALGPGAGGPAAGASPTPAAVFTESRVCAFVGVPITRTRGTRSVRRAEATHRDRWAPTTAPAPWPTILSAWQQCIGNLTLFGLVPPCLSSVGSLPTVGKDLAGPRPPPSLLQRASHSRRGSAFNRGTPASPGSQATLATRVRVKRKVRRESRRGGGRKRKRGALGD